METSVSPPPGFIPHFRESPLTEPWKPIFSRQEEGRLLLGLYASAAHLNSRGFVHGGLIAALADNAMGLSLIARDETLTSLVTVSLSLDFLDPVQRGQWLEFRTEFVRPGRNLCFAQCFVFADEKVCARADAKFKSARKQTP